MTCSIRADLTPSWCDSKNYDCNDTWLPISTTDDWLWEWLIRKFLYLAFTKEIPHHLVEVEDESENWYYDDMSIETQGDLSAKLFRLTEGKISFKFKKNISVSSCDTFISHYLSFFFLCSSSLCDYFMITHRDTSPLNHKYIYFLLPAVLFVHLYCFVLSFEFWRYRLWRCLPSLEYNGTTWHFACDTQSDKKII